MTRDELKYALHLARVNLDYHRRRALNATAETIAEKQAEVDRLAELYADTDPARCTLRVKSPYFIGPRRRAGTRGDGPTIKCFRCEEVKPREEIYTKGTVCKACTVKRSAEWAE